ncbi:MAG: hypothetical protein IV100_06310 [Myxococcales bacterium]|nr:hypothetical protein [Myxococcales bacterium]
MTTAVIASVMLRADDPARLGRFYRQLFDVELLEDEDGTLIGTIGELSIAIMPRRRATRSFALGRIALGWRVDDIDAALARLGEMTPEWPSWVREDRLSDVGRHVILFDPEGNEVGLYEPHPAAISPPT